MELWDAYNADGTLADLELVRGEKIPQNFYHLVCEAVIRHTDGEYLLMQRDFQKELFPGKWEIGAGGSALKGENRVQAVLREVREETGIESEDLQEIYCLLHEGYQAIFVGYLLTTTCEKDSIQLQEGETVAYKWVSKEELIAFFDGPECMTTAKERLRNFIDTLRI